MTEQRIMWNTVYVAKGRDSVLGVYSNREAAEHHVTSYIYRVHGFQLESMARKEQWVTVEVWVVADEYTGADILSATLPPSEPVATQEFQHAPETPPETRHNPFKVEDKACPPADV